MEYFLAVGYRLSAISCQLYGRSARASLTKATYPRPFHPTPVLQWNPLPLILSPFGCVLFVDDCHGLPFALTLEPSPACCGRGNKEEEMIGSPRKDTGAEFDQFPILLWL